VNYDFSSEIKKEEKEVSKENKELDPVTKFQHRQAQTQQLNNHGKSANPVEQATNNQQSH